MPGLPELQRLMLAAITGDGTGPAAWVRADGIPGELRLQVYRNNTLNALVEALRALHPVVERLVGKPCFDSLARHYVRTHRSGSANVHDYGARFAPFLRTIPELQSLPYLPDMAELERAYHEVFHAADATSLSVPWLATLPTQAQMAVRAELHPAARLLQSQWPLLKIWQANQPGPSEGQFVDQDEGGVQFLVIRRHLDIDFQLLDPDSFALLELFAGGNTLSGACAALLTRNRASNPSLALGRMLAVGVLVH